MTNQDTIVVRINCDVHRWLMDHRTYDEKSISDVIKKLVNNYES